MTDLYTTLLSPPLLWTPPFYFVSPLPPNGTPLVETQNLPPTLLTTVPPSYFVLTVSTRYLSTMQHPPKKKISDQLLCPALLLFYLPLANRNIHSHFLVPCHLPTTCHSTLPHQYPPMHASPPLWMKHLMISFAPIIVWNKSLPCIITLNPLAWSHCQISSPTYSTISAAYMEHFSLPTFGIWSSLETSVKPQFLPPLSNISFPC